MHYYNMGQESRLPLAIKVSDQGWEKIIDALTLKKFSAALSITPEENIIKAMNSLSGAFVAIILLLCQACVSSGRQDASPLEVVPFVDLSRYAGQWYEIARFPHRFQKGCVGSKAEYSLRTDGRIDVLNECHEGSFSGKIKNAKGKARIVDNKTNAKLKVSFFWPFSGDYWIIDLGKDYEYAVVGHPDRSYLWILSRTNKMDETIYQEILGRIKKRGFDVTKLIRTPQE